jgi:tetratricopeptide (TPR) repeat protein
MDLPPGPEVSIEEGVQRAVARISDRDFEGALVIAGALQTRVPENRDVLYVKAISLRMLGRIDEAMMALDRLEAVHPSYSRLHEERGHCFVVRRDATRAIDAFLRAVNMNSALPSSWTLLEGLYRMKGERTNAETAAAHLEKLRTMPPEVVQGTALFSDGELDRAEQLIRPFLLQHGNHVEAMRLLARIGLARGVLDDAEILLEAVVRLAPDYLAARLDYAQALADRHKYAEALSQLEYLARIDLDAPLDRRCRVLRATVHALLGDHETAIGIYRGLVRDAPPGADLSDIHLSIAHAQKTVGRTPEAVESYRAAAQSRPGFGDAYWSLANLKTHRFTEQELANMRAGESNPRAATLDRYHFCFALGKALEDRGEHEESWRFYERGNALKRAESRYRPEILENNTRLQKEICTRAFFDQRRGWGTGAPDPIFVLGLPRSGSTLIEQILASHSRVEGTQELPEIQRYVIELQGRDHDLDNPPYPGVLAGMAEGDFTRHGERYLRDTKILRSGRPFFIDKMPNNFRHIGLIHLMLPNAKIIDARREPMACCFSNFKQLFANGQEFTYSIEDIARYYRTYLDLMEHWDEALPGRVLRVHHESVVDSLEGEVRRILDFCGLEFEPGCVEFHRTARSVRTASSEQVRQPIFREGLDQWKHFEPWLGGLREALGDAFLRYSK